MSLEQKKADLELALAEYKNLSLSDKSLQVLLEQLTPVHDTLAMLGPEFNHSRRAIREILESVDGFQRYRRENK